MSTASSSSGGATLMMHDTGMLTCIRNSDGQGLTAKPRSLTARICPSSSLPALSPVSQRLPSTFAAFLCGSAAFSMADTMAAVHRVRLYLDGELGVDGQHDAARRSDSRRQLEPAVLQNATGALSETPAWNTSSRVCPLTGVHDWPNRTGRTGRKSCSDRWGCTTTCRPMPTGSRRTRT